MQDINQLLIKINLLTQEIAKINLPAESHFQETYLTSKDVMEIYKISKSQLSDLRIERKIPYSKPFGVIIYPKSEIEKIITSSYNI